MLKKTYKDYIEYFENIMIKKLGKKYRYQNSKKYMTPIRLRHLTLM